MYLLTVILTWLVIQVWGGIAVLQRDDLQQAWHHYLLSLIPNTLNSTVLNLLILLLPVTVVAFFVALLGDSLASIPVFLLNTIIVLFAIGRGDAVSRSQAFRFSINDEEASVTAAAQRYYGLDEQTEHLTGQLYQRIAYQLYERWFAVIFWFLILGAPGALLYRMCHNCIDSQVTAVSQSTLEASIDGGSDSQQAQVDSTSLGEDASLIVSIMDWLPARIWVLILGAASYFGTSLELLSARLFDRITASGLFAEFFLALPVTGQRFDDEVSQSVSKSIQKQAEKIETMSQHVMLVSLVLLLVILLLV
ncbi:MAG: hypothetical protein P8M71_01900 [Pseudomonadales bacterium]|nr:hypothetical protein [Pseudomonadales bacterium]